MNTKFRAKRLSYNVTCTSPPFFLKSFYYIEQVLVLCFNFWIALPFSFTEYATEKLLWPYASLNNVKSPAGREVAVPVRVPALVQEEGQVVVQEVVQEALLFHHHQLSNCFCFYSYFSFFSVCTAVLEEGRYRKHQLEGETQKCIRLQYQR